MCTDHRWRTCGASFFFDCEHQPSTNDKSVWFGSIIAMVQLLPLLLDLCELLLYGKNCIGICSIEEKKSRLLLFFSCWLLLASILKFKIVQSMGKFPFAAQFWSCLHNYLRQINLLILCLTKSVAFSSARLNDIATWIELIFNWKFLSRKPKKIKI